MTLAAANFVAYNPNDGSLVGAPDWARATQAKHADDPRHGGHAPNGTTDRIVGAATDDGSNAAQRELLHLGQIESTQRMYWGKNLIEWLADPASALTLGLLLNDRYALDGRSANGLTNLLWYSGRHDWPWPERLIFGTVRTMTASGLRRKLDAPAYIARLEREVTQSARARTRVESDA